MGGRAINELIIRPAPPSAVGSYGVVGSSNARYVLDIIYAATVF